MPQTAENPITGDDLSKSLDTELSNGEHNQARTMVKHGKDILLSKHVSRKKNNSVFYEEFKVKYNEKKMIKIVMASFKN